MRLFSAHEVHPYSNIDTTTAWKKTAFYFICQVWPMTYSLSMSNSILPSVYPWYTNTEQNGMKDKLNSVTHTKTFIASSSSSCRATRTDIPDPLSPLLPIVPSPPAGLQSYIPYPHIAAVCMFELVVLLLLGHMRGSIGVHHLWARPCFSSSVTYQLKEGCAQMCPFS